jgi:hypothetical protein
MAEQMYIWPDWMPCPLVNGYGLQVVDRRLTTEMEVGSTKRVEFDTDECIASCTLICDDFQSDFLETFERDLLKQGSRWFLIKLWLGGQLKQQAARFRDRPQITGKAGMYSTYSFTLDVSKRDGLMDSGSAELLLIYGPDFINQAVNRLHYILHIEAPKVTTTPENIWTATLQDWENAK